MRACPSCDLLKRRASSHAARAIFVHHEPMIALIIILIILAVTGVLGFVVKGLLWLGIIAAILFVIGLIWGGVRGRSTR
jgi:type IV secretory pathway TrbL component